MKKDAMYSGIGVKALSSGGHVKAAHGLEPGDLDLINGYALVPLKAADVSVYTMQVANDQVDRDTERFSADVLTSFAASLVGKALLEGHDWGPVGIGRFFRAWVTTENGVTWLMAKAYLLNDDEDAAEMITKLNGGVASFISVGFFCPERVMITDATGASYGEYRNGINGEQSEAIEASLVFLGAQYDAAVIKSVTDRITAQRAAAHKSGGAWMVVKDIVSRMWGKQGRVLSQANLDALKSAVDLAEQSGQLVESVIAAAEPVMDESGKAAETAARAAQAEADAKAATEAEALANLKTKGDDAMTPEQIEALKAALVAEFKVFIAEAMTAHDAKCAEMAAKVTAIEAVQGEHDEMLKAFSEDTEVADLGVKVMDRIENIEAHLGAPKAAGEPEGDETPEQKATKKAARSALGSLIVPAELRA